MNTKPKRLFQLSPEDEIQRTKDLTIKGIGLLSRNSQTLEQGAKLLKQILPTLTSDSIPLFLQLLFQVKVSQTKQTAHPKATRQAVRILGECVQVQPEISSPYIRKIIQYILSHLQSPEGSIEKMHLQCALALTDIAISVPPGPVIGSLFQCYFTKRRIGESFFHLQIGASICLQRILKTTEVIGYLKTNEKSLGKVISKLLSLISLQNDYTPAPVLQVWHVLIDNIEECHKFLRQSAPQLISNTVQALSSGVTSNTKKTFSETSIFWKNRSEAARLLSILPQKLPAYITKPYGNEVLQYLEQSRHDRIKYVRDEVRAALAAWKKLMNVSNEETRTGNARMDFSGFSYKDKPSSSPSSEKRTPIRQFIQQSRKSTPRTQDPVVLIPRNSSPYTSSTEESKVNLFDAEDQRQTTISKPIEFENFMDFNETNDSLDSTKENSDSEDEFDVISLSEFPDTPVTKPNIPTKQSKYTSSFSPSHYSSSIPNSSPLHHLAPTPIVFEMPSLQQTPSVGYTATPTQELFSSPSYPTSQYHVESKNTPQNVLQSQFSTNNTEDHPPRPKNVTTPIHDEKSDIIEQIEGEDILERIYDMNHQITELYRKQIALVDSIIPGKTSKDDLARMLHQQQQEISSLTKHVCSIETEVECVLDETEKEIIPEKKKEIIPDVYKERSGIPQEQWNQVKDTVENSVSNRNSELLSTVFSSVLENGTFSQCIFLMEKSYVLLESLSLEDFHLAFDFVQLLASNSCCGEVRSVWLNELLKVYTPLKAEHRKVLT